MRTVPSLGGTAAVSPCTHVCAEGVGEVAEPATPIPPGSHRSHRVSKMGSKQVREPRGEGGARDKRIQEDWKTC